MSPADRLRDIELRGQYSDVTITEKDAALLLAVADLVEWCEAQADIDGTPLVLKRVQEAANQ